MVFSNGQYLLRRTCVYKTDQAGAVDLLFMACRITRPTAGSLSSVFKNGPVPVASIHTSAILEKKGPRSMPSEPRNWQKYNDIVYPPSQAGEPIRPAEITHYRSNVKSGQKKLWYVAAMIRGMSIDEAIKQLDFYKRQVSTIVKETLIEAQELAVKEHNVEFKSNLWIADSFVGKALTIKGTRKHARRMRPGIIHYRYSHYFVRLREGPPPKHYYQPHMTGHQKMEDYLQTLRNRRIFNSL